MDDLLTHKLATIAASLSRLLPRQLCRSCQRPSPQSSLCCSCHTRLTQPQQRCYRCAHPLSSQTKTLTLCGECLRHPPPFERTITATNYADPVSHWINRFKHQRELRDGHLLSQLLLEALQQEYQQDQWPDLMVSVPLHWRRLLTRSFNQADWVSHCLRKQLAIPAANALRRVASHRPQQDLTRQQRLHNLKGCFVVAENQRRFVQGRHIALIDDVVTTTSTARVLSGLLLKAGAERVDVWCLARTPSPSQQLRDR